jgi:tetratricopeptide (TPR) repeat protein
LSTLFRRNALPQLGSSYRASNSTGVFTVLFRLAIVLLAVVLLAPYWLPAISWFIPDRYIMAYAPQALQKLIFQIDPSEQIPTPSTFNVQSALALLSPSPATATATLTPPDNTASGAGGGYLQPTSFAVAATPTLTPVYAQAANDPRALDRNNNANLSNASHLLTGFTWIRQGANNCGPASITTLMSYWGVNFTQDQAAAFLKPNPEDPNVRPDEIAAFVATKGYLAMIRINGNIELLKKIILAGYPVLIETGYNPEPQTVGWTSHYLTLAGFSDEDKSFIAMDTYRRPNWAYPYAEIDTYWRQFNRRYIIIYRSDQAAAVASLVGTDINDQVMYTNALKTTQLELSLDRNDAFGWFNLGYDLTELGRYEDAVSAFDQARILGLPSRFLWYQFTIFDAYLAIGGKYDDDVIALADDVLEKKATEESFYYKGLALAAQGKTNAAREQLRQAIRFNSNFEAARKALAKLGDG